jgi:hypothetical protein
MREPAQDDTHNHQAARAGAVSRSATRWGHSAAPAAKGTRRITNSTAGPWSKTVRICEGTLMNRIEAATGPGLPRRKLRASARELPGARRCRRKFLRQFPGGFRDETYLEWERDYKVDAHGRWRDALGEAELARLLAAGEYREVAQRAVRVEQRTRHSMIFSFEKMALRDAVKSGEGARAFARGLHAFLHGTGPLEQRFEAWVGVVAGLPRRQTRVLTWPMVTVWGFLAQPGTHIFLKPTVIRLAAAAYGYDLPYRSRPNWETYAALLELAAIVRADLRDLAPRDMIDIQSFLWVQGSDEYA